MKQEEMTLAGGAGDPAAPERGGPGNPATPDGGGNRNPATPDRGGPGSPAAAAPRRRRRAQQAGRDSVLLLRVAATVLAEGAAFAAILLVPGGQGLALGLLLHALAAILGRIAARRRRRDLAQVESDLVLVAGLLIPLFGPLTAWALPRPAGAKQPANAHDVFASYADHVKPAVPDYERTLFTGSYERDMARELDVESYHEVLVHGTTDQKRSALHRLAELGETKHFRLIRQCLLDLEHEVRLYAYSELERASRRYEEEIARRARELKEQPEQGGPLLAIARAYFEYAATGIHDEAMGAWYYRSAEQYAGRARRLLGDDPEPVWIQARAFGRLGDYDRAKALLQELTEPQRNLPESCLTRAELAYARRDFLAARAEAARIRDAGAEPPPWLAALEGKRR
jgi:tetratricopeptide (TPR) repeat protein